VLADQTRLQRLHAQLQQDYDRLRQEREDLKTSERGLRLEIAKLRYQSLPRL
jgi:phage shock protein A